MLLCKRDEKTGVTHICYGRDEDPFVFDEIEANGGVITTKEQLEKVLTIMRNRKNAEDFWAKGGII